MENILINISYEMNVLTDIDFWVTGPKIKSKQATLNHSLGASL